MTPAVEDFEVIQQRMKQIIGQRTGECKIRNGGQTSDCWCYKAGPDGNSLPCPPKSEAEVAQEQASYDCG